MTCLGFIPARKGSKRLPGKNVRPLGGKPLVAWAIECGLAARSIDRLVVSSDDEDVLAIAAAYGPRVTALRRPAELATDTAPVVDAILHAVDSLQGPGETGFDPVVILQPTSPFTQPEDVDATVALLKESGADSAVSVVRLDHAIHPVKLKTMVGGRLRPYLEAEEGRMAYHELPELYVRNCSVYATRMRVLLQRQVIGADCRGHVMPRERSVDINDAFDFAFAEFLLERGHARC